MAERSSSNWIKALKRPLRAASAVTGALLLVLSCAGFKHARSSGSTLESRTTFGCLCFLGACFGLLLFLAELQREFFFFFFGFLRYRIGRAALFAIAGVMMTLVGKTLTDQCDCDAFVLLIIEGVACMALAVLHTLAICALGNCTTPSQKTTSATTSSAEEGFRLPGLPTRGARAPAAQPDASAEFTPVVKPIVEPSPAVRANREDESSPRDNNMPSWMRQ